MPQFRYPEMAFTYILSAKEDKITHAEIAKRFGVSQSFVDHMAAEENWKQWREDSCKFSAEKMAEMLGESKARLIFQNLVEALKLRAKASAALETIPFEKASEASLSLERAQKLILEALGDKPPADSRHELIIRYPNGNGDKTED